MLLHMCVSACVTYCMSRSLCMCVSVSVSVCVYVKVYTTDVSLYETGNLGRGPMLVLAL